MSNYTGLFEASRNLCPYPLIAAQSMGLLSPDLPDSISNYRYCYQGCCMPCPSAEFLADFTSLGLSHWNGTQMMLNGSLGISFVSLFAVFLLIVTVIVLPKHFTRYNIFIVAYAFAAAILCMGYSIGVVDYPRNMCYDGITSASQENNLGCAVSGLMLVFALYWTVMISLEVALLLHLSVVWGMKRRKHEALFCFLLNSVVSIVFTAVNAVKKVGYHEGAYCSASRSMGLYSIHIPLIPMSCLGFLLQLSTFFYTTIVILQASKKESVNTWSSGTSSEKQTRSTSRMALNRTADATVRVRQAIVKSLRLQWRPLLVTTWTVVVDLLTCAVFILVNQDRHSPTLMDDWVKCLVQHGSIGNPQAICLAILEIKPPPLPWWAYHIPMYLVGANGLVAATWEWRYAMLRGWWLVFRHPRSFWTLDEWKNAPVPTTRQPSPNPNMGEMFNGNYETKIRDDEPPMFDTWHGNFAFELEDITLEMLGHETKSAHGEGV